LKHIKSALTYLEDAANGTYKGDYETYVVKTAVGGCIASILQNKYEIHKTIFSLFKIFQFQISPTPHLPQIAKPIV